MQVKKLQFLLGQRIKKLRESLNLSRSDVCLDELELSARQLARIEAGESLLTIPSALFLAERLNVEISILLNPIPKEYFELKNQILHLRSYNDTERKVKKEYLLDQIFENYFELLPKSEQLSITILQTEIEILHSGKTIYGESLYQEFLTYHFDSTDLSINDILWIDFYFIYISGREDLFSRERLEKYISKLIGSTIIEEDLFCFLLLKTLTTICGVLVWSDNLSLFSDIEPLFKRILLSITDSKYKTIYFMMKAKYSIFISGSRRDGVLYYESAIEEAKFAEDDILKRRIEVERENDLDEKKRTL